MLKPLAVSALALCCFGSTLAQAADIPPGYDYPYADPWLATASVALLKDPKLPEKQVKDLTVYPARAHTPLFDNKAQVYYVTYRQEKPADLVVLVSGLGSVAEDPLALYLGGQIFAAGYNVLVVPDAFNWQFALGASRSGYPGVPSIDAGDLENFIVRARDHAVRVDGMKIRQTKLVGYSMGALESAFLAAREAQHPRIKFDKVVLLNPPVDTFYDLHQLDTLAETGKDWPADVKKTVKAKAFDLVANANLTDPEGAPYFRDLAKKNTLTDDQLKFVLFGLFHGSLTDVIMVSQQIRDIGILKTPASKTSLDAREKEADQYGFSDYLNKFVVPAIGGDQAAVREKLKGETLYGLKDFLASHREVEVFHNADDFLVRPQDIAYLQNTMGNRLTLFPHGGHMGNIWYPANQQMLAKALGSGPVAPLPAPPPPPAPAVATDVSAPAPTDAPAAPAVDASAAAPAAVPATTPDQPAPVTAAAEPPATPPPAPEAVAAVPAPAPQPPAVQPVPVAPTENVTVSQAPVEARPLAPVPMGAAPAGNSAPGTAMSTPDAAPPVTAVVTPPASPPAADPLAPLPPSSVTTTTTTTTAPVVAPPPAPSYTVTIPQIPSATPADHQPPS